MDRFLVPNKPWDPTLQDPSVVADPVEARAMVSANTIIQSDPAVAGRGKYKNYPAEKRAEVAQYARFPW